MNTQKSTLAQIRQIRIEKANKLRSMGIDPYPAKSFRKDEVKPILDNFSDFEGKEVIIAGRLMSWREHGHLIFGHLQDPTGKIQLYIKDDTLKSTKTDKDNIGFEDLGLLDVGDIIEAKGIVTKTQRGEISVQPNLIRILTKAIRPLPDKWKGIEDKELRFRRRYLDFTMDPDKKQIFERKQKFYESARTYLKNQGFLEVEVPVLEPVTGGADARPFVTYHNDLNQELFLRISTELYQKRLNGGDFGKIFTLGPNFRNEGVDDEHLQEYYQIEWYWPYANYKDNMELTRDLFRQVALDVYGKTKFTSRGHTFDLADEWEEIDYAKIIQQEHGIDIFSATDDEMFKVAETKGLKLDGEVNRMRLIDNLWKLIRKEISGPAFLLNEPKFMSPLSKSKTDNPELTERFHIIIAGSELGNGYTELNDPIDQLERFQEQQGAREAGDEEAQMLDIDFVEMLEYGMPPNSGFGMSERVFWYLEDLSGREATLFPQMKVELENTTKQIYNIQEPKDESQNPELKSVNQKNNNIALDFSQIPTSNIAKISPNLIQNFQGIKFAYIVLDNLTVDKSGKDFELCKKEIENSIKERYTDKSKIKSSQRIQGYRNIYKSFGADPDSTLNSAEALIRRVFDGKGIYCVNNVVDTYNITSAELEIPMAAYDLDKISNPITLRIATQNDQIQKIGEQVNTEVPKNSVVYSDSQGVICMNYNYRDSDRTKITKETKRIILFADGHKNTTNNDLIDALKIAGSRLENYTGAKIIAYGNSWDSLSNIQDNNTYLQNINKKIVIIVNKELENWKVLNTVGHISANLGHKIGPDFYSGPGFETKDGQTVGRSCQYPVVVLSAKPGQFANLRNQIIDDLELNHFEFCKEHLEIKKDEDIKKALKYKGIAEIEYYGIGIQGPVEKIDQLTKKFSLWK